jgi:hypothetical protein
MVWRTIHKYEQFLSNKNGFFSNKAGSENRSLECPVFELPRQ